MSTQNDPKLKLHVILASTRPGRVGETVAKWFVQFAQAHEGFETKLVDLAEVNLPLLDEPNHPRLQKYQHEHTKQWSRIVSEGDAFVVVTPEYNYGMPATLLNAFDYVYTEWNYKPVGFVSYGGISGGMRSVQMSKQVVNTLKMMPMLEAVTIPFVNKHLENGRFVAAEVHEKNGREMLEELHKWGAALKGMRESAET